MNWIRQMKLGYSINLSDNRILNETDFLHELKRSSASIEEFSLLLFFFWIDCV